MTASLSYTSQFGNRAYYGLRVNPTFDEVLQTVRKPLRVPLPNRAAKWYATGPYRAFLLDAAEKFHSHQQAALDYQKSGAHLPEAAAMVRPSEAGEDPAWQQHARQNEALHQQHAYEIAFDAMNEEHQAQTRATRREQLSSYGPNMIHPTIQAHHYDLDAAQVRHDMPAPRPTMPRRSWPAPYSGYAAAGHPQEREFPTFERLNQGQATSFQPATLQWAHEQSYDHARDAALGR